MGVEIAINITKWDKKSTWERLAEMVEIKTWKTIVKYTD